MFDVLLQVDPHQTKHKVLVVDDKSQQLILGQTTCNNSIVSSISSLEH